MFIKCLTDEIEMIILVCRWKIKEIAWRGEAFGSDSSIRPRND